MDKIVFMAYRPKTQQPVRVTPLPVRDEGGRHFTGQGETGFYENIPAEEGKRMAHFITPKTSIKITDGKVLNLENPIDAANWVWIQKHPYIALHKDKGRASRDTVFYIQNKQQEAIDVVKKDEVQTRVKGIMYAAPLDQLHKVAKALGHPSPEAFSIEEVRSYLLDIIATTPDTVEDAFKPENQGVVNVRSLLRDLQRHKIIVISRGSFFFGGVHGTLLGRNEDETVEFLMATENEGLVDSMTNQLNELMKNSVVENA